jgi:hypothetical protein
LKIRLRDDPNQVAESFCKIYCLKEEIKDKLSQTIAGLMKMYLNKGSEEDSIGLENNNKV